MNKACRQGGFSLIEAMVALLVIMVGLLGVAGLQALAINNTHGASLRSIAAIEAGNMAAYMESNWQFWTEIAPAGVTVLPQSSTLVLFTGAGGVSMQNDLPSTCTTTACTKQQLAAWDMRNWGLSLGSQLPLAKGGVQCGNGGAVSNAVPLTCVVTVQWQEKSLALNGGSTQAPAPSTSTATYSLVVQP